MGTTVDVAVALRLVTNGEYRFQSQLPAQTERAKRNDKHPEPSGRLVTQTSSVIAPGLAQRLPAS